MKSQARRRFAVRFGTLRNIVRTSLLLAVVLFAVSVVVFVLVMGMLTAALVSGVRRRRLDRTSAPSANTMTRVISAAVI